MGILKLGTVAGRHDMPVDRYIAEASKWAFKPQDEYDRLYEATEAMITQLQGYSMVEVYTTGWVPYQIAVLDCLSYYKITHCLMSYDYKTGRYDRVYRQWKRGAYHE